MQLIQSEPELFPYSTWQATGIDPLNDPHSSSLSELTSLYFEGPDSYAAGIQGTNTLDRSLDAQSLALLSYSESDSITTLDQKLMDLMNRAVGRTREIGRIRSAVLGRPELSQAMNTTDDYNMVLLPVTGILHCELLLLVVQQAHVYVPVTMLSFDAQLHTPCSHTRL